MKKFAIALFGAIFVTLIACSIQSISADHESSEGIFKEQNEVNLVPTQDSNYQVHLQAVIRNGDGHLISITESTANAAYIPHKLTDDIFDTLMGKKEIITIDGIKYEKVQYTVSPTLEQRWIGMYPIYAETKLEYTMKGDAAVQINKKIKHYTVWKIHYCATYEGHGYGCLPVFQVLIPSMMLEPSDTITNQWTILRDMN